MFKELCHHHRRDKEKTREELILILEATYSQMKEAYRTGIALIKHNPELSPSAVIDSLDEDAVEILRLLMLLRDAVNIACPGAIGGCGDNPYDPYDPYDPYGCPCPKPCPDPYCG